MQSHANVIWEYFISMCDCRVQWYLLSYCFICHTHTMVHR